MKIRSLLAWVAVATMVFSSVAPVGAFHFHGGLLGKLHDKKGTCCQKSCGRCCVAPKTCTPVAEPSCVCAAPAPEPVVASLPCCPCNYGSQVIASAPVVESAPVSLPCCPCGDGASVETVVVSEAVVEDAAVAPPGCSCNSSSSIVSGETIVQEAIVEGETTVDSGAYSVVEGGDYTVVEGDVGSSESVISEGITSTDVIESTEASGADATEDSATDAESTPAPDDAGDDSDLLDAFDIPTGDGATYKKHSSKMRFVFVRTNELAKARQAVLVKAKRTENQPPPRGQRIRLKFTPGIAN